MSTPAQMPPPPPGFVPMGGSDSAPPPPPGFVPMAAPPKPQPAQDAIAASLSDNPHGEGVYSMVSPTGARVGIPYSNVQNAARQGHTFADKPTLAQYARDHAADPVDESAIDRYVNSRPWYDPISLASLPARFVRGEAVGLARGAAKTLTAFDRPPTTQAEQSLQLFANTPNNGPGESTGETGENMAEFLSGEELLGMLGKAGKALPMAERMKQTTQIAQLVEKHPILAKLAKIGISAVKQGTVSGGQTFMKTGGDADAAETAGLETGAGGAALEGAAGVASAGVGKLLPKAAEVKPGEAEYAAEAREAARPALEDVNASRRVPEQEVMTNQPGGAPAVPSGRRVATATGKPAPPQLDVDRLLNQMHDFTGAADRLTEVNDEAYNAIDRATAGKFRQVNADAAAAQKAMWKGEEGGATAYKAKQAEMSALIDGTGGEITPEMKEAAKRSWRQAYQLRDFGNLWDRNLNGIPGSTQVSQTQRGVNGNGLMRDLQRAVKTWGRGDIESALGQGRLENLENIARANQTNTQRKAFNSGVSQVARHLPPAMLAGTIGGAVGHMSGIGGWEGAATAEVGYLATTKVLNAVKANPKIAQNLIFAIDSGADPKHYGPLLATMIQKANTDASSEQQRTATSSEGQQ